MINHIEDGKVNFQWKNPDFLLKNLGFLLKNVDFIVKRDLQMAHTARRGCGILYLIS